MATEHWDEQLRRLLKDYREPELPSGRLDEIGRRLADRLREDSVLDANLRTLLPQAEEPLMFADRLDEIGSRLAGQLAPRNRRRRRRPAPSGSRAPLWAGLGIAAAFLMAVAVASRSPAPKPPSPPAPLVRIESEPEPLLQPEPPAVVKEEAPAPKPPPPPPPLPEPLPRPVAPAVEPPAPAPKPAAPTVVEPAPAAVAVLEAVEGDVQPREPGRGLIPGDRIVTGKDGRARVRYDDGTSLVLDAESALVLVGGPGKLLQMEQGRLTAEVKPQPAGRPLAVATPGADVQVLGTRFTLSIAGAGTRLEVEEGRVRLTRRPDGASVDVAAGHFAVAARGTALLTRPIPEEPKTFFLEIEQLSGARGTKPADGPARRPFLEPWPEAQGGVCVAVPGSGMDVAGELKLAKGTWHLWVRYRDEPGNAKIGFTVMLRDQVLGQFSTPGRSADWLWQKVTFAWPGGPVLLTLRSQHEASRALPTQPDVRFRPYAELNRWDRICLTPDERFTPE